MAAPRKRPATRAKAPARRKPAARKPAARKAPARAKTPARKTSARKAPPRARRIPVTDRPPARDRVPFDDAPPPRPEGETPKASPFHPGFSPECMACPLCMFYYVLKNTKPEAMEHLMKAAFEIVAAGRAVLEQYGERWEQAEKLERITIS